MPKSMQQLTAAHTGKVLQECKNLLLTLRNNDRDIGTGGEEFLEYMKTVNLQRRNIKLPKRVCPECGGEMLLYQGDDDDSHWVCKKCRFSIYNEQSPTRIIMGGLKDGKH